MSSLPGAAEATAYLKRADFRDFAAPADESHSLSGRRFTLDHDDIPVPELARYSLALIGLDVVGAGEKIAWSVCFDYRGVRCVLAHQKFGLRLYVQGELSDSDALKTRDEVVNKLKSARRTVEKLVTTAAPELVGHGNVSLVNQHSSLRRAYDYFRERALDPAVVEDKHTALEPVEGLTLGGMSFTSGSTQMRMNSVHDLVAAITAYLSLLEHEFVLALAFNGFDPTKESLTDLIGARWGEKFARLVGAAAGAGGYKQRLTDVVERWRNPYSHGGFEKGHGATIYLHVPGAFSAIPVGLSKVRSSRVVSLLSTSETEIADVFALFDEVDTWLDVQLPEAMQWIRSGLNVRFDEEFRAALTAARDADQFGDLLEAYEYAQYKIDNMEH